MKFPACLSRVFFRFRGDRDNDLRRELESHLDLEAEEQIQSGADPDEARYAAQRALGNSMRTAEEVREVWGWAWLDNLVRDLRYGARALRKSPGFTVVAVLTLALGIGANSAIFSVIDALMLEPLPFSNSDQLVRIDSTKDGRLLMPNGSGRMGGPSAMDMRDFAQRNQTFENMSVYDIWRKNVSFADGHGEPQQMFVGLVPGSYFEVLDVKPIRGRLFTNEESYVGRDHVAAISAQIWKNHFGADPQILGRKIRINDEPYTIVAVMPDVIPEWMESRRVEIWTPFTLGSADSEVSRAGRGDSSLGRLKPGVSIERARADLATIAADLAATHPVDRGLGVALEKLSDTRVRDVRPMLLLLTAAVSLILLIACVNLANLLLARNSIRQRELAIRTALGSGRSGLVRQLLAETALLALTGGAAGLVLAKAGVRVLARMRPASLPQLSAVGIDGRVLLFTLAVSIGICFLFGLAPALAGTRVQLVDALKQGGRSGTAGVHSLRMRTVLVIAEIAMSLLLVLGASLLVQSILHLERQQLGIRKDHLLTGHFFLPGARYPDPGAITRFTDQFADGVRSLPGVLDATVTTIYPPNYNWPQMLEIPAHPVSRVQDIPAAQFALSDSHFLRTMGIPLLRGRDFSESDTQTTAPVALITSELERRYFSSQDPIGQRIHIGPPAFMNVPPGANITDSSDVTIIGVIGDIRNSGLTSPPEPQIVVLYAQHPLVNYGFKDIVIRTAADPHRLVPEITRRLHTMDADMPFAQVRTIDEIIETATGGQRFTTFLLVLFAGAGLALAIVGIYGVVSYLVSQRTQELAVRMAIGASAANILWLVLRQGLKMALIGCAFGLFGAYAARRLVSGLLFGISPLDPATFAVCIAFLLAVALLASAMPGCRAMRIDLVRVLREE